MRRLLTLAAAAAGVTGAVTAVATAAAPAVLHIAPVARLPFPERGYVVDLPRNVSIAHAAVRVVENGKGVGSFSFAPLAASGIRFGAVLAVDSSLSMKGDPYAAATAATKNFVARRAANERVGIVAFNGRIDVRQQPTQSDAQLSRTLSNPAELAYGTRIFDAIDRSVSLLTRQRITTGAVVLLSDGADVGSRASLDKVLARARARHVRVFTVGLRSKAFDPATLQKIATETGGTYAEAASAAQLAPIYAALGERLAGEYLLQYRSSVPPRAHVDVRIAIDGFGGATTSYTAPTPAGLPPYHRSLVNRFLLSPFSLLLLALAIAAVLGLAVHGILERSKSRVVERVSAFVPGGRVEQLPARRAARAARARGWLASLERDLEIAGSPLSATRVVIYTIAATAVAFVILALISPVIALIAFLVPFVSRSLVKRQLKGVRDEFADQLPPNLQILASALRSGHSFSGALGIVVENADEPSRRELRRAVTDEQFGVEMDIAIHRVALRMASRDLEQVALLAELQRTTGGNAAEVLDTVVETIRERADVRRLVKTLTAQGRMARWILTALPVVTGLAFFLLQPDVMRPMLELTGGQVALVLAAFMVAAGSVVIQRIVDIEV
jgi:tight adherence protein B